MSNVRAHSMVLPNIGAALIVFGAAGFLFGLYGLAGEGSPVVAVLGGLGFITGAAALLLQLNRSARARPHVAVVVGVTLGVLLHAYEQLAKTSAPSLSAFLWPLLPYAVCMAAAVLQETRVAAIGGVATALAVDLLVHYDVFVSPSSSTASLAMLFMPLWSLLVFTPIAMLVTWFVVRRCGHHAKRAP